MILASSAARCADQVLQMSSRRCSQHEGHSISWLLQRHALDPPPVERCGDRTIGILEAAREEIGSSLQYSSSFCCKCGYAAATDSPAVQPFDILHEYALSASRLRVPVSLRVCTPFATNLHE